MPVDRRSILRLIACAPLLAAGPARAGPAATDNGHHDESHHDDHDDDDDGGAKALRAARFPQPVRVGQLVGRTVLQPLESQPVLGHVRALVRGADGAVSLVMGLGGWLGWGARPIAVPLAAVSLMGEYVVATGLTPDQLARLPTYDGKEAPLPANDTIKVGLVKPAH